MIQAYLSIGEEIRKITKSLFQKAEVNLEGLKHDFLEETLLGGLMHMILAITV